MSRNNAHMQQRQGRARSWVRVEMQSLSGRRASDQLSCIRQLSVVTGDLMFRRRGQLGPSPPASRRSHCIVCNSQKARVHRGRRNLVKYYIRAWRGWRQMLSASIFAVDCVFEAPRAQRPRLPFRKDNQSPRT